LTSLGKRVPINPSLTDEVVDEVHFALRLPHQTGWGPRAGSAVGLGHICAGTPGMFAQLRRHGSIEFGRDRSTQTR
jgi:hypothetical protein